MKEGGGIGLEGGGREGGRVDHARGAHQDSGRVNQHHPPIGIEASVDFGDIAVGDPSQQGTAGIGLADLHPFAGADVEAGEISGGPGRPLGDHQRAGVGLAQLQLAACDHHPFWQGQGRTGPAHDHHNRCCGRGGLASQLPRPPLGLACRGLGAPVAPLFPCHPFAPEVVVAVSVLVARLTAPLAASSSLRAPW